MLFSVSDKTKNNLNLEKNSQVNGVLISIVYLKTRENIYEINSLLKTFQGTLTVRIRKYKFVIFLSLEIEIGIEIK